ncbi:hypothetical protein BD779DRAFT_1479969 [Infundibulicybe gibba]|nr:hypothetical protein BD779DRAFT_1479969 [Infundibulicybe gibba]
MVRPQKYHTAAEKASADRLKSKNYYQRNKSAIAARRRTKYLPSSPPGIPGGEQDLVTIPSKPAPVCPPATAPHNLSYWQNRAVSIIKQFELDTQPTPQSFCNKIYKLYNFKRDKTIIDDAIISTSQHQKSIRLCHAEILQLDGAGKLTEEVLKSAKTVDILIHWLEEMSCYAAADPDELLILYTKHELAYQCTYGSPSKK